MVWIDYRFAWELDSRPQYLILWLGICSLFAVECCLAYLWRKNQNLVYGCHANGFHGNQFNRGVALVVLVQYRFEQMSYTFDF